jgi:hypothetical protein
MISYPPRLAKMVDLAVSPVTRLVSWSESVRAAHPCFAEGPWKKPHGASFFPIPARPRLLVSWAVGAWRHWPCRVAGVESSGGGFLANKFRTRTLNFDSSRAKVLPDYRMQLLMRPLFACDIRVI